MRFERKVAIFIPKIFLPNYLTAFRILACVFLLGFFSSSINKGFIIITIAAVLSDFLDGVAARARNQKTKLGILIDPLADKLLVATVIFILFRQGGIDLLLISFIFIGELHVLLVPLASFVFRAKKVRRHKPQRKLEEKMGPILFGKIKSLLYFIGFISIITGTGMQNRLWSDLGRQIVLVGVGFSWLALIIYLWRWAKNPY